MPEVKDPRIKLFGKTIALPKICHRNQESHLSCKDGCSAANQEPSESDQIMGGCNVTMMMPGEEGAGALESDDSQGLKLSETAERAETGVPMEKPLQKPEAILPCPRCDSKHTKFCYFNNYKANQPRHFCKSCRRYWTAGGVTRNVPFGAGRRKIKHSTVKSLHATGVQTLGMDHPMASSLKSSSSNGWHPYREPGSWAASKSSISTSRHDMGKKGLQEQMLNWYPQSPCFPGSQWHTVHRSCPTSPSIFAYGPAFISCTASPSWAFPGIIPPSATLGKHPRDQNNHREGTRNIKNR